MHHVFVDTNVFLSLYAYTDDNIEELKKCVELIKAKQLKLYIPSTVNQEFYRNRDKKIFESLGNLEKFSTSLSLPRFVDHHQEAQELRDLLKIINTKRSNLVQKAKAEIIARELAADKLFSELTAIASVFAVSPEATKAARLRLEHSNPPGKDGSLGDRLNWEFLLEKVPDGSTLHLISRDKDFASPIGPNVANSFLAREWEKRKNGTLILYAGFKSFIKEHFPDISLAADVEKALAIKSLVNSKSWQQTHAAIAILSTLTPDISDEEAKKLFLALLDNSEIRAISGDGDVEKFYQALLTDHWQVMSADEYKSVTELVEDPIPF